MLHQSLPVSPCFAVEAPEVGQSGQGQGQVRSGRCRLSDRAHHRDRPGPRGSKSDVLYEHNPFRGDLFLDVNAMSRLRKPGGLSL